MIIKNNKFKYKIQKKNKLFKKINMKSLYKI